MFLKYNWPGIVWALVILTLLAIPGSDLPDPIFGIKYIDKIGHFGIFFVLILLVIYGFNKQYSSIKLRSNYIVFAFLSASLWAVITELVQLILIQDRSFEFADIGADFVGVIAGIVFFLTIRRKILFLKLN
jgi:hypothetical protein